MRVSTLAATAVAWLATGPTSTSGFAVTPTGRRPLAVSASRSTAASTSPRRLALAAVASATAPATAASAATTAAASTFSSPPTPVNAPPSTIIIGAGPTGLATAIMLARRGWSNIHIYDRLSPPPDPNDESLWSDTARFYLIGLGGRGQKSLKELGVWDEVKSYCTTVVGRKDWPPDAGPEGGVERIFVSRCPS